MCPIRPTDRRLGGFRLIHGREENRSHRKSKQPQPSPGKRRGETGNRQFSARMAENWRFRLARRLRQIQNVKERRGLLLIIGERAPTTVLYCSLSLTTQEVFGGLP